MSEPELESAPVTLNVTIADASNLTIHHVNALGLRTSSDEFYFTLGVVMPPDQAEITEATKVGHLVAQPVFRFAISRDTMEKFLAVMATQYDQQTEAIMQFHSISEKTNKEEVSGDE